MIYDFIHVTRAFPYPFWFYFITPDTSLFLFKLTELWYLCLTIYNFSDADILTMYPFLLLLLDTSLNAIFILKSFAFLIIMSVVSYDLFINSHVTHVLRFNHTWSFMQSPGYSKYPFLIISSVWVSAVGIKIEQSRYVASQKCNNKNNI